MLTQTDRIQGTTRILSAISSVNSELTHSLKRFLNSSQLILISRTGLGDGTREGYFPNAKLLVTRQEWESVHGLLPIQADWYCPEGTTGTVSVRYKHHNSTL